MPVQLKLRSTQLTLSIALCEETGVREKRPLRKNENRENRVTFQSFRMISVATYMRAWTGSH